MSRLPESAQKCLNDQLDWDHAKVVDHDLNDIAKVMIGWEEKLSAPLNLSAVEIHDLKAKEPDPELLR